MSKEFEDWFASAAGKNAVELIELNASEENIKIALSVAHCNGASVSARESVELTQNSSTPESTGN